MDRRRKISWQKEGELFNPPDRQGEVFWIVELVVTGKFAGFANPTVQFMVGTKVMENWVDPKEKEELKPTLPICDYAVEATFRRKERMGHAENLLVRRAIDAEGRYCIKTTQAFTRYVLRSGGEAYFGSPLEEGVWAAIITGDVRDQVSIYESVWQAMVPSLLEMSKMPEMYKMEKLYLGVEHHELHTDVGAYDEGREAASLKSLLEGDSEALKTTAPQVRYHLLHMPPPQKIKRPAPVEHSELHTDNSESEYDA